jgi:hypothetical protein
MNQVKKVIRRHKIPGQNKKYTAKNVYKNIASSYFQFLFARAEDDNEITK